MLEFADYQTEERIINGISFLRNNVRRAIGVIYRYELQKVAQQANLQRPYDADNQKTAKKGVNTNFRTKNVAHCACAPSMTLALQGYEAAFAEAGDAGEDANQGRRP